MSAPCHGATLTVKLSTVDVSCDVISVDIQRGRTRLWDPPSAADCQLVINAGKDGQPWSRGVVGGSVTVHLAYGTTSRMIFTGWVQQKQVESTPEGTFLQVYAVDGFEKLSRVTRLADIGDTAVGAGDTVDERIARWLDEADYTGDRSLSGSLLTCPEIILGADNPNVLENIHHTAEADGGDFYFDGDGTATFRSWAWRNSVDDVDAVFSDQLAYDWVPYSSSVYRDDLDELQNHVMGVRRKWDATDPVVQTEINSSSVSTYGDRGDALMDLELEDDSQVATRVVGVVAAAKQPSPRFDPVVIQPGFKPNRSWPKVLRVGWGSLIITNRIFEGPSPKGLFGHVIGERWKITPNDCTVIFRVSGTATWDQLRVPRPPINVITDPITGKVCIPVGIPCPEGEVIFKDVDGDILATYPPGSLCFCETGGGVIPPEGTVEICFVNDVGEACIDYENPVVTAVLWLHVVGPDDVVEMIDSDEIDEGAWSGYASTEADVIPGDFDAIVGTGPGGPVAGEESAPVLAATFSGGWTIDFWMKLSVSLGSGEVVDVVDLDQIKIRITGVGGPSLNVVTLDGGIQYLSPPLATPLTDDEWHRYLIVWDPDDTGVELRCYIDGVET